MTTKQLRYAVVGATGVVGRELLAGLAARQVSSERIVALATAGSAGGEVEYMDDILEVERASADSFRGVDVALFAVPSEVSRSLAPAAQGAGAWVVDASDAFRDEAPLLLPLLDEKATTEPFAGRIVAIPRASTTGLVYALEPLRRRFGLAEVDVTGLFGASCAGLKGIEELERQTKGLLSGQEIAAEVFPQRVAFNLIPQVGAFEGADTAEERALVREVERLWRGVTDRPTLRCTAIAAPLFYGVVLSVTAHTRSPVTDEAARAVLADAPGLKVLDAPAEKVYPMPMLVTADAHAHVGRLRASGSVLSFVVALDNAGAGAAAVALDVATKLCARGG